MAEEGGCTATLPNAAASPVFASVRIVDEEEAPLLLLLEEEEEEPRRETSDPSEIVAPDPSVTLSREADVNLHQLPLPIESTVTCEKIKPQGNKAVWPAIFVSKSNAMSSAIRELANLAEIS